MAETDECAHRACFLIAEVTVIHSVVIRATGSTAIDIFVSPVAGIWVGGKCSCVIVEIGVALMARLDSPVLGRVLSGTRDPMAALVSSLVIIMLAS